MRTPAGQVFGDLLPRLLSALAMLLIGGGTLLLGGIAFDLLCIAIAGAMFWELARMTGPTPPKAELAAAVLGAVAVMNGLYLSGTLAIGGMVLPAVLLAFTAQRMQPVVLLYSLAIVLACVGLVGLRADPGLAAVLWLLAVVIASDVAGYFAGRSLGGPKLWPAISPKKTWSGTVAGWVAAAAVGAGFALAGQGGWALVLISPLVAFAGQIGDIAESWIKRRCEVKDSSTLIPGHGGVLDRFDALIVAVVLVTALAAVLPLPLGG